MSALSSGITDKSKYLRGEEILPPDQSRMIEQATFTYSPLEKTSEKQTKTNTNQASISDLFSKDFLAEED